MRICTIASDSTSIRMTCCDPGFEVNYISSLMRLATFDAILTDSQASSWMDSRDSTH